VFSLEDIGKFIARDRPEGIIVDTGILILFLIGSYDPNFIGDFKRTSNYSIDDFELLKKIFAYFKKLIITPQILAELSTLSITKGGIYGDKLIHYLQAVVRFLESVEERYQKSNCLCGMELEVIGKYGLTDMTMFELSKKTRMPILTDDLKLYNYSYAKKVPIIKFEYIKSQQYQSILAGS